MVSISTIGLGLLPGMECLPADRWIFSIPAAAGESWRALRGPTAWRRFWPRSGEWYPGERP
jgi:hypothetical protein